MTEHQQNLAAIRPRVILVHPWELPRTGAVPYLAHLRPQYAFESMLPEALAEVLIDTGNTIVVICDVPTPAIREHARGWLMMPFDGPHIATAGVGDESRSFPSDNFEDMLAALDDLVTGQWRAEDVA